MGKATIIVSWLFGLVVVVAVSSLLGYINIVLDFVVAFVGGATVTRWAFHQWIKL